MRLDDALDQSSVQAAYRPYYRLPVPALQQLYIVVRGHDCGYDDAYLVHADTFNFFREMESYEHDKLRGMTDWEPVAKMCWQDIKVGGFSHVN